MDLDFTAALKSVQFYPGAADYNIIEVALTINKESGAVSVAIVER
jgi:hypothetical protein